MQLTSIYGPSVNQKAASADTQPQSQPLSPAQVPPQSQAPVPPSIHASISWVGILLALVALRIVWEMSER